MSKNENEELSWEKMEKQAANAHSIQEYQRQERPRVSVCHLLFKMQDYRFIQLALATLKPDNSSLTPAISTSTGSGLQNRHCADTTSVRPVQIAQAEGRQVEGREEFKEIKQGQRRCEISTSNAKSQQKLLKEDFKERAQNAQSNSEDAKKAQIKDYKDFDGAMQIFNQDKAVCGQMKFGYKFLNDSADQKNDEEPWGGGTFRSV